MGRESDGWDEENIVRCDVANAELNVSQIFLIIVWIMATTFCATQNLRRNHHGFLLEDDVEVSPHFYAWAKWATLAYQYGTRADFAPDMYGVSLYTPR